MSKGSSKAPDYAGAAQATAAGNLQNLNAQTIANRPDMYTPFGNSTWNNSGIDQDAYSRAIADWQAAGAKKDQMPTQASFTNWTNTVTLTPEQQQALDAQQRVQLNQSNLAEGMQGQVADTMAGGFNAPSMGSYMSSVPGVNSSFSGFNPTGVGGVDQRSFNPLMFTAGTQKVNQNFTGNTGVNTNAPQFDASTAEAGTKAAYDSSTALLKDQWEKDTKGLDTKLKLQGLVPGTEAYDNAMRNLTTSQEQTRSKLANDAVLTGNELANRNYASSLAGFDAGNTALGQQFGQNATSFGLTNDARTQALDNGMKSFQAMLQGQQAGNQAQGQAFEQAMGTYGANTAAQQMSNEAQAQQYAQALQNYNTAYQSAYSNYMMPLNAMNAVLTGNQVQNPTFNGFAQAGYTPGADYSGAASALGQWQSAQSATNAAGMGSAMGALGTLGGAAIKAGMFSDKRLKMNIKRIGKTRSGLGWYSWTWKGTNKTSEGVIAQEVRKVMPHAVSKTREGFLKVNYLAVA